MNIFKYYKANKNTMLITQFFLFIQNKMDIFLRQDMIGKPFLCNVKKSYICYFTLMF